MNTLLDKLRKELKQNSDINTKDSAKRFFKEEVKSYGVKTAVVGKIGKRYFSDIKDSDKKLIFNLCNQLWSSGYLEETFIACNWSYYIRKKYEPKDFRIFEKWVKKYVTNWASCDTLCNHTVGSFLELYPDYVHDLKKWARSQNRWMRRASAVSLIIPARNGKFLSDILDIADSLLLDEDDLVRKGYGWMLKAASESHQMAIFDYVLSKKEVMPRTALRYAIEKMPKNLKTKAMEK